MVVVPLQSNSDGEPILPSRHPSSYTLNELWATSQSRNQRDASVRRRRATSLLSPYVTAKLVADELTEPFVIGDEKFVNGFHNRPLEAGRYYTFFILAVVLSEDEVVLFILNTLFSLFSF